MRSQPKPDCLLCGGNGVEKYPGMTDRLFGAAGSWTLVECSNCACGLLWLNPQPIAEDIHEAYSDYYTHRAASSDSWLRHNYRAVRAAYLKMRFGYQPGMPTMLWHRALASMVWGLPDLRVRFDSSVMWLPAQPGGRLLEVGCGRGDMLEVLAHLGWDAEGVDFDPRAAESARARGLRVCHGTLASCHYDDATFDAVIMSHVIEHLHDPVGVVKECYRILKPGGHIVLLTPNTGSLGHRLYGRYWLHLDPPRHLYLFNSETLAKLAEGLGFSKLKCFSVIRDANWTLGASGEIKNHGAYQMGQLPIMARIASYWLMYIEWFALLFNGRAGEEIVLFAKK
jgi:2-polyprenyl-3-methyl-5-hydroxy-6-metoxy-1,4-benzoquinol methylase